jgi:hypothetical protein
VLSELVNTTAFGAPETSILPLEVVCEKAHMGGANGPAKPLYVPAVSVCALKVIAPPEHAAAGAKADNTVG